MKGPFSGGFSLNSEWQDIPEDDGLTLGPEEALFREIQKSKSLKVERLKLRDDIEKLQAKNQKLEQVIEKLEREKLALRKSIEATGVSNETPVLPPTTQYPPLWIRVLLVFNLLACVWLIFESRI
ncbi:MAG: hypothetical protein COV66_07175 [Nitrospinae bacterium CG11_big_fil_rev_8_21_14_0_20_45_15]|nr:MAG: hypothetical protein COV66_07175 [Nitrospinae bacterium CG11_big_fil_rev_8_21_14_0_20_45_15]